MAHLPHVPSTSLLEEPNFFFEFVGCHGRGPRQTFRGLLEEDSSSSDDARDEIMWPEVSENKKMTQLLKETRQNVSLFSVEERRSRALRRTGPRKNPRPP